VPADPSRRALIAAAAALPLLAAGCRGTQALGTPPRPAPDVARLRSAIQAEELMVARYRAAMRLLGAASGGGAAGETLSTLLAEHSDHLRQLRARLVPGSSLAASSRPVPRPPAPVLPTAPRQVIEYLSHAELAASNRLLGQVTQVPPALAQLLASIAASEATHVPPLRRAGAGL
jgi:hypothetical protein